MVRNASSSDLVDNYLCIKCDALANKNISVVKVATANEPVSSSSVEIEHL